MKLLPKNTAAKIFLFAGLFFAMGLIIVFVPPLYHFYSYQPKVGDIVFQSIARSRLVITIEGMTNSKYSHCGIVVKKNGAWYVLEASTSVVETPLYEFFNRGRDKKLFVYRLNKEYRSNVEQFVSEAIKFKGRPSDIKFKMDDEKIYCSELVYKAFKNATGEELGKPKQLQDMNWKPYVKNIEFFEQGPVPLKREIISPGAIAKSEKLERVY